ARLRTEPSVREAAARLVPRLRAGERIAAEHGGQRDVLENREVRERPRDLIGAREPGARDAVRFHRREVAPLEEDAARVGTEMAAYQVDQSRFPGAVRTHQP